MCSAKQLQLTAVAILLGLQLAGAANLEWWKGGPLYQIYPATFADSNGDGWGDLQGIINHAAYFKYLGVPAIWISSIYESPMRDNGYDVSDFRVINREFGNMGHMDNLIRTFHDLGIKVILDFVPNHTSNESVWFTDSIFRTNNKADWYVWKEPRGHIDGSPIPPNNWRSAFGGSAWTYVQERNQYYYHKFKSFQPDLNYNNPAVLEEIKSSLRFWLAKGIDGFRMDSAPSLVEDNFDKDERMICHLDNNSDRCLSQTYTANTMGTHQVLKAFDAVLGEPAFAHSGPRFMYLETYNNVSEQVSYYGNHSMPLNYQLITKIDANSLSHNFVNATMEYLNALHGKWPTWVIGNQDQARVAARMGKEMINTMNILALLLPGTAVTYYGEELGMTAGLIPEIRRRDFATTPSRDPSRTPMQWNISSNAGFSSANPDRTFLPVNHDRLLINVQSEETMPNSHLGIYRAAVELRKRYIDSSLKPVVTSTWGNVFAIRRPGLLIVTSLAKVNQVLCYNDLKLSLPARLTLELSSDRTYLTDKKVFGKLDKFNITGKGTLVFSFNGASSILPVLLMPILGVAAFVGNWAR